MEGNVYTLNGGEGFDLFILLHFHATNRIKKKYLKLGDTNDKVFLKEYK